ncbi:MAG: iron chelate uptake ABC transporter family permease subunit [Candidatus Bathyarchaeales archaeon]
MAFSISGSNLRQIDSYTSRLLIDHDHRIPISAAVLMGASFLIICDGIARVVVSPAELPVVVITAICGGPFFLYLVHINKMHALL